MNTDSACGDPNSAHLCAACAVCAAYAAFLRKLNGPSPATFACRSPRKAFTCSASAVRTGRSVNTDAAAASSIEGTVSEGGVLSSAQATLLGSASVHGGPCQDFLVRRMTLARCWWMDARMVPMEKRNSKLGQGFRGSLWTLKPQGSSQRGGSCQHLGGLRQGPP